MEDDPELVFKPDRDPLAEPAEFEDPLARDRVERGLEGPQQERVLHPHVVETLADDPPFEGFDVDRDVRELGHASASSGLERENGDREVRRGRQYRLAP